MSKKNRERRAAKRRHKQRTANRRPLPPPSGAPHRDPLTELRSTLDAALDAAITELWRRRWTPATVMRVVERRLTAAHSDTAAAAIITDARRHERNGVKLHPAWREEIELLEQRGLVLEAPTTEVLAALVRLLSSLPDLPRTMAAPGEAIGAARAAHLDQRVLHRVRALLAKAESTEFDEEADALTAKAQELITRHAIDEALLESPDDLGDASARHVFIDDPYADAKASLVAVIAKANRCTAVYVGAFGWSTVFGFDADLDAVELLYASLLAQATSAMARHGSRRDASGRSTTRSFRRSFLYGFSDRIGQRLKEAADAQVSDAAKTSSTLLPVLASRDERVQAAQQAAFPHTKRMSGSVSNGTGYVAGQAAANNADLSLRRGALR